MARGQPDTGPYTGRGLQHMTWTDKATGDQFNAHYAKYTLGVDVDDPAKGTLSEERRGE